MKQYMKLMEQINEKTRIGMTPSQVAALVILVFGIGTGFSVIGNDANQAKEMSKDNKKEIEAIKQDVNFKAAETLKMFYEIRESQARIEEQLKQKMDK